MLSWRLWRALQLPYVSHPLYRMQGAYVEQPIARYVVILNKYERFWLILFLLGMLVLGFQFGATPLLVFSFGLPFLIVGVVIPIAIISIGTVYGVSLAFAVSSVALAEKRKGRYMLMTLTPRGIEGATWAMISVVFHTYDRFLQIRHVAETVYYTMVGITVFLSIPTLFVSLFTRVIPDILVLWVVIITAICIDFMQSVNIACIIGILAPTWARDGVTVHNYALLAFLSLQITAYVIVAIFCFVILPQIGLAPAHYLVACLFVFYMCREIATAVLWKLMTKRLNTSLVAFDDTIRLGIQHIVWGIAIPNELMNLFKRTTIDYV